MSKASGATFNPVIKDSCISSGTLRTQDLLRAFTDEYERLSPTNGQVARDKARKLASILDRATFDQHPKVRGMVNDAAHWALERLFDQLQHFAPEGCYFGAHEGDGACFGFWSIDED